MSPQEPLLKSEKGAKGRPQSKHCCFASVIYFPFISLECFPKAGITHYPPARKWEQGGKATHQGYLSILQLASSSKGHMPAFPTRCHVERDLLCCFSLCSSVAAMEWMLVCLISKALACFSCCWHQPLRNWLAPAVEMSSDRLPPMLQTPTLWRSQIRSWWV